MVEKGVGIKLIRSGLNGGDMGEIYFIFFSILKTIFKLLNKYKKNMLEMAWLLTWLNVSLASLNKLFLNC